jgi:DNA-binding response OmpR family regulator
MELTGHHILIVEDEPLIAFDLATAFEDVGATVAIATSLSEGVQRVEDAALSAAVLDYGLQDGDCDVLCTRLASRGIPFIFHSGFSHHGLRKHHVELFSKPADPMKIIAAIKNQLRLQRTASNSNHQHA